MFLQTLEEVRRKLAMLDTELNKEKSVSRRYQVAVEKLMQFVEVFNNDGKMCVSRHWTIKLIL